MTQAGDHWETDAAAPPAVDDSWWEAVLDQGENSTGADEIERGEGAYSETAADVENGHAGDAWGEAERVFAADEVVELLVIGYNRGGLIVRWGTVRGFVPASHLSGFPADCDEHERDQALSERVGQALQLKIIEYDQERGRVVLSERAARTAPGMRRALLTRLQPGEVVAGAVTNITDFGAFVDLGGVEGLLHVSELSWGRVEHPRQLLTQGQQLDVYVISTEPERGRVALSVKRMQPDPWADVESRYAVGQIVVGTITDVAPFGAFTRVEEGLEGLIHVSELAEGNFMHPANVVREGQTVRARIVSIDGAGRRLGLSLRRVEEHKWRADGETM